MCVYFSWCTTLYRLPCLSLQTPSQQKYSHPLSETWISPRQSSNIEDIQSCPKRALLAPTRWKSSGALPSPCLLGSRCLSRLVVVVVTHQQGEEEWQQGVQPIIVSAAAAFLLLVVVMVLVRLLVRVRVLVGARVVMLMMMVLRVSSDHAQEQAGSHKQQEDDAECRGSHGWRDLPCLGTSRTGAETSSFPWSFQQWGDNTTSWYL